VTVPVRDAAGQVIASLFITAPSMRMRLQRPKVLLGMLLESAEALSRSLGYEPPAATAGRASETPVPATPALGESPRASASRNAPP
jgi:hypothetical protein